METKCRAMERLHQIDGLDGQSEYCDEYSKIWRKEVSEIGMICICKFKELECEPR